MVYTKICQHGLVVTPHDISSLLVMHATHILSAFVKVNVALFTCQLFTSTRVKHHEINSRCQIVLGRVQIRPPNICS